MLRQCAWCLRLIDLSGERISAHPLPKLYEASHGMCSVCGILWMEEVLNSLAPQNSSLYLEEQSNQGVQHAPYDQSSHQSTFPFPPHLQEADVNRMLVYEKHSSYSSHIQYFLSEEQESLSNDDISDPTKSSRQNQT